MDSGTWTDDIGHPTQSVIERSVKKEKSRRREENEAARQHRIDEEYQRSHPSPRAAAVAAVYSPPEKEPVVEPELEAQADPEVAPSTSTGCRCAIS